MFDTPLDAPYLWLGIVAASLTTLGIATSLTTAPPTGAERVAAVVDEVAASPFQAVERVRLSAQQLRIESSRIALRDGGGVAHAPLSAGPVTPVRSGPLAAVLEGRDVRALFDSPAAFADAMGAARNRPARWRVAPETLTARRVSWGAVDGTLVG